MNDIIPKLQSVSTAHADQARGGFDFLDVLFVLARNKTVILLVTFLSAVLAAGISLLEKDSYTASVKLLPPQRIGNTGMQAESQPIPSEVFIATLKSHNLKERLVQRFDLQRVYQAKSLQGAISMLCSNSTVAVGKGDVIEISVDDLDPQRAAILANAYAEELNKTVRAWVSAEAGNRRQYLENEINQLKPKVASAQVQLETEGKSSAHYQEAIQNFRLLKAEYDSLFGQYQLAKLDETRQSDFVQVLDNAHPPENKSKPRRSLMVISTALGAFLLVALWFVVRDFMVLHNTELSWRLRELFRILASKRQ